MRTIFIIGSHRTATKSLARYFEAHYNEVESHHQFNTLRFVNVLSNMFTEQVISSQRYETWIQKLVVNRIKEKSIPYYLESNGFNYLAAFYAQKHLSDVRIVHVIRDPRDFVSSYLNWTHERWPSRIASKCIPFWNVNGQRVGSYSKAEWSRMNEFERTCWQWAFKNQKILSLSSNNPESFCSIKFEDLVTPETRVQTLTDILELIGLEYKEGSETTFDTKENSTLGHHYPPWRDWDPNRCQVLHSICGPIMHQFGYGAESEWEKTVKSSKQLT